MYLWPLADNCCYQAWPSQELPSLPNQPTPDEEEAYLAEVSCIVEWLQGLGGKHIKEAEQRIWQLTRWDKGAKVNPMALFYF